MRPHILLHGPLGDEFRSLEAEIEDISLNMLGVCAINEDVREVNEDVREVNEDICALNEGKCALNEEKFVMAKCTYEGSSRCKALLDL